MVWIVFTNAQVVKEASNILDGRYELCDSNGRFDRVPDDNYSSFCYKHTAYSTAKTDALVEKRDEVRLEDVPADPTYIDSLREEEITEQKRIDYEFVLGDWFYILQSSSFLVWVTSLF